MSKIGIRHEEKYLLERRVALTPTHVEYLIKNHGIEVYVQRSAKRVFKDEEYAQVGAILVNSFPEDVKIIVGVKEMPLDFFRLNNTAVFFSHTIKGQDYNMPMLKRMMDMKMNLIDYEKITDGSKRLIFFGRFAGLAGAINALWSLGNRFNLKNIPNPFSRIRQSYTYSSLNEAISDIRMLADEIRNIGLPPQISPLVLGITGYGNVSKGAQEIIDLLPIREISAEELDKSSLSDFSNKEVVKVVFKEADLSVHKEGDVFDLQNYYAHPDQYRNNFERFLPKLNLLLNCMYWDTRYPRIITKDYLHNNYQSSLLRLEVIADITCDPDGSIECTHTGTPIVKPVYTYNPSFDTYNFGFAGQGLLIMAVDILPSELPRESSSAFGDALLPFIPSLASANFELSFDELNLVPELKRALILHNGELTPDYKYINKYIK